MLISPRLQLGMAVFVVGLALIALALPIVEQIARRRVGRSDDHIVRLVHNSAVPLAIQIVIRAIDMAFAAVLYRVFARDWTPLNTYIFAAFITTLLLATVAEWGLNIWLTREVARDRSALERTFGTALVVRLCLALLVVPASLLVAGVYSALYSAGLSESRFDAQGRALMLILACTVIPDAFRGAVTALFLATEQPVVPAVVNLLTNMISALLKIIALVLGLGILGVAWAALGATLISTVMFGVLLRQTWGWPRLHMDVATARRMLSAGFPLMLNGLLLAVFFRFDITIIQAAAPEQLASYDAAYKFVGLTQILPPIVINAVFPLFARHAAADRAALCQAYDYLVRLLLLIALPLAVGISVLAPTWIALLADAAYVPLGAPALGLLIWYLPLSYVNGVTQYVLIALDRPKTITFAFALAAVFNFSFNLVFVPRYGINAAAMATVLAEVVLYGPLWWMLRRELAPTPLWAQAWRPLTAAVGMALGMALFSRIHAALAVLGGPLVYYGLLLATGAVQDEDRRLARRVLRRA